MLFVIAATVVACIFIGWSIGANDAANCVGSAIGSGKISFRVGIVLVSVFGFLGALLIGQNVIKTVGKGIVPLNTLDPTLALYIALSACFGAGLWVVFATFLKIPVSTSHSIVGAVGGAGLAVGAPIFWDKLLSIFIGWIATPFGAALIAYVCYYPFRFILYRLLPSRFRDRGLTILIVLATAYLAFSWGGNDVANATGVIIGSGLTSSFMATLIGASAIVLGIVTLGYRVIETVAFKITRFIPMMTLVAQFASALNVYIYTVMGIPVSTSHSIVGAVVGVGLATRKHVFDIKLVREIVFAWAITPFAAGFVALLLMTVIKLVARI
ncbi:MAG: inorganic phosphate transporter [Candidatus Saganbacteria bacterium]|nr:inorganic phosphate transporter [Candidatus Saganbacteria bacterium]